MLIYYLNIYGLWLTIVTSDINDINLSIFITRVQHDLLHGLQGGGGWGVPHRVREDLRDGDQRGVRGEQRHAVRPRHQGRHVSDVWLCPERRIHYLERWMDIGKNWILYSCLTPCPSGLCTMLRSDHHNNWFLDHYFVVLLHIWCANEYADII